VARACLLGGGSLDRQPRAAQLSEPVGLVGVGQGRQPAVLPDGDLGQAREHRRGRLRVQRRGELVKDLPDVCLGLGEIAP
jgi:hypothetical protein